MATRGVLGFWGFGVWLSAFGYLPLGSEDEGLLKGMTARATLEASGSIWDFGRFRSTRTFLADAATSAFIVNDARDVVEAPRHVAKLPLRAIGISRSTVYVLLFISGTTRVEQWHSPAIYLTAPTLRRRRLLSTTHGTSRRLHGTSQSYR